MSRIKLFETYVETEYNLAEGTRKYYGRENFTKYPYVIHFSQDNMADAVGADSVQELIDNVVKKRKLKEFSIFKQDSGFHSTTQDEYLKTWYDEGDGYWSNMAKKEPELMKKNAKELGLI